MNAAGIGEIRRGLSAAQQALADLNRDVAERAEALEQVRALQAAAAARVADLRDALREASGNPDQGANMDSSARQGEPALTGPERDATPDGSTPGSSRTVDLSGAGRADHDGGDAS